VELVISDSFSEHSKRNCALDRCVGISLTRLMRGTLNFFFPQLGSRVGGNFDSTHSHKGELIIADTRARR